MRLGTHPFALRRSPMRKLKLEDLAVESFDAMAAERGRGTVRGHTGENTCWAAACQQTDDDYTCRQGCFGTQAPQDTCYNTCFDARTFYGGHQGHYTACMV
jgi:hypothetical protein